MPKKYKTGMYGGKFMPFHKGHLFCVEKASSMCENLYVILFYGNDQELEILKNRQNEEWLRPDYRLKRIKEALKDFENVHVVAIDVTNCKKEDGTEDWEMETPLVLNACGKLDAVFGSEKEYSDYYAKAYPDADYIIIDEERKEVPISGTLLRSMSKEEREKWIV